MVIFGKKAKALVKRVEVLEWQDKHNKETIKQLEGALKDLALTVENGLENRDSSQSPQQLLREWFLGAEKEGGK